MSTKRYDFVIYGVSGFTGAYILEEFVNSKFFEHYTFAVAGRNEGRIQKVLDNVSKLTGRDVTKTLIIIADSANEEQLAIMARQAKLIINAVGPYRLYGEAVVSAAVNNGASHVDISGEPAYLELMQLKYGETAKENGVYIVGACGWDSIPCDLGINWIKENFDGTVSHAETFAEYKSGEAGNSFNAGTWQTIILGFQSAKNDNLREIRKSLMPEKLEKAKFRPPKRCILWWNKTLQKYCLPFKGADKSIVQRSQYYDAITNGSYPVSVETYMLINNLFWSVLLLIWMAVFSIAVKFEWTRKFMQKYPAIATGNLFKEGGPTREQVKQGSFTYWFVAHGWPHDKDVEPNKSEIPKKRIIARCDGSDPGYTATSQCVLAAALTLIEDEEFLPKGGAYTTAALFKNTKIYSRLESFGITFRTV